MTRGGLAFVPSRVNGHAVTSQERQLQRVLVSGRSPTEAADLMRLTRPTVTRLMASLRKKGIRPGKAHARRPAIAARGAAESSASVHVPTRKKIGAHLRALRHKHGLTQAALAGDFCTAAFVSLVESGTALPSLRSLVHFGHTLGIPVRETLPKDL